MKTIHRNIKTNNTKVILFDVKAPNRNDIRIENFYHIYENKNKLKYIISS